VSTLSAAGIEVITDQSGTVRKAVEDYKAGKLTGADKADASGKSGKMNRGTGMGRGMGGGGGMGRSTGGRGSMGQGMGRGRSK